MGPTSNLRRRTRYKRASCEINNGHVCEPVRADLHDGDSCHRVSSQDGVKDGCWTTPPGQQAGVDIQHAAGHTHTHAYLYDNSYHGNLLCLMTTIVSRQKSGNHLTAVI